MGLGRRAGLSSAAWCCIRTEKLKLKKCHVEDTKGELARLEAAQEKTVDTLNGIYLESRKRVGEQNSMIFQIHKMMIQDEDFSGAIRDKIETGQVNAEYAVWETGREFSERFAKMDSEYMRSRKTDIIDVSRRLLKR